mmetsp:Transcript_11896/g.38243  ORF Transcript_11896/g.38243 Transcript_11896/m.38243 type:complete len:202 (-) Transcript_11896:19-624(-)
MVLPGLAVQRGANDREERSERLELLRHHWRLPEVLRDNEELTRRHETPNKNLADETQVPKCSLLAQGLRLLLRLLRSLVCNDWKPGRLEELPALGQDRGAEARAAATVVKVGVQPRAKVRIHGGEVVLHGRLLEDLTGQNFDMVKEASDAEQQLVVQLFEFLHGELVQNRPDRALHGHHLAVSLLLTAPSRSGPGCWGGTK